MSLENPQEKIPEDNELPLNIKASEKHAKGAETIVWKTLIQNQEAQDELIALKQIHREQFATDDEMQSSKRYYEFLKGSPEFGKFVPETLFFKARMSSHDKPQGYMLQRFSEGKSVDQMSDEELYDNLAVVQQLLEFAKAAAEILRESREKKMIKPDFAASSSAGKYAVFMANNLVNPRFSNNIIISDHPNEDGQQVFFCGYREKRGRTIE